MSPDMPSERPHPRQATGPSQRRMAAFSAEEKRRIFKAMVVSELEAGLLRYTRRQRLLKYAETLGIPAFEASLLIAEAQFHAARLAAPSLAPEEQTPLILRPNSWPIWAKISFALVIAVIIDVILIRTLSL